MAKKMMKKSVKSKAMVKKSASNVGKKAVMPTKKVSMSGMKMMHWTNCECCCVPSGKKMMHGKDCEGMCCMPMGKKMMQGKECICC